MKDHVTLSLHKGKDTFISFVLNASEGNGSRAVENELTLISEIARKKKNPGSSRLAKKSRVYAGVCVSYNDQMAKPIKTTCCIHTDLMIKTFAFPSKKLQRASGLNLVAKKLLPRRRINIPDVKGTVLGKKNNFSNLK